ncbi:MAG TPA: TIGR03943 family protein [Desulfobacteraceae bacterium]|nr:TIGR03943 family protein [Desulfobacteraceae bacterium]
MAVKRLLPALVLAVWFFALAWLIRDDHFQLFLKPDFKWLIYTGMIISLVLTAGLISKGISRMPVPKHAWIKGLILLLPIGFIFSAGENTLGEYALSKRVMVIPGAAETPLNPTITSPAPTPVENKVSETTNQEENQSPAPVSISTLIREFDRFNGMPVQVEGMFAETIDGHDELSAVFRYFITCCAADAQPVGVFIPRPEKSELKSDDWVRVSGRVAMRQMDGYDIIYMDLEHIEAAEKPGKNAAYIFN